MPNTQSKPKNNSTVAIRKNPVQNKQRTNERLTAAPVAMTKLIKTTKPVIISKDKFTTVRHKEYLADIVAPSAAFNLSRYPINPALNSSFPWLSSIAERYESYVFEKLNYIYEPICSTATPGSVMLGVDYDAADASAANKVSLLSYASTVRSAPWEPVRFSAAQSDLKKFGIQRYTRVGNNTGDIKTYDVGAFQIATQSTPATATTLGELYVEYEVKLYTPQLNNSIAASRSSQKTKITWGPTGIPSLTAIISGIAEYPLMWLDNSVSPLSRLIIATVGTYLFHYESSNSDSVFMPPNFNATRQNGENISTKFFNIVDGYFNDVSSSGSTIRTKIIGPVNSNSSASTQGYNYTVINLDNAAYKTVTINALPIDFATASNLAGTTPAPWGISSSGSDFPEIVLNPPKLIFPSSRTAIDGCTFTQDFPSPPTIKEDTETTLST